MTPRNPSPTASPGVSPAPAPDATCPVTPGERTRCLHCGLALSRDQIAAARTFCCGGCERVYGLLRDGGLTRFYDLRTGTGLPPPDAADTGFAWLDPLLEEAAPAPDRPHRITLDLQGVHCAACVWLLETLFRRFAAGVDLRINPSLGKADIAWIPAKGDLRDWLRDAESFGYRFGLDRKSAPRRSRELLVRLGITVAAAVHVMMFSLAYYFGLAAADGLIYTLLGRLSLAFTTLAVATGGWVFFRGALGGIRRRMAHLDLPIAAGILLAFGGSVVAYVRYGPEAAYFDTVSIFIALMLTGRWLQERVLERNRNALLADGGVDALYTRRIENGALVSVPAPAVRRGDELAIVPGDLVPVAGVVVDRPARLSLAWITGESDPVVIAPGEVVPAGAQNAGEAVVRLAAGEDFADSRLVDLLRAPAAGDDRAAASVGRRWWNRVSAVYVAAVFALAALGFALWIPHGLEAAIRVTVAILVVTCPCALGLAVPLAQELVHTALQRRGVFLRSDSFFDRALSVTKVVFDKTGTLTLGRLRLLADGEPPLAALSADDRAVLTAMTARSNHPVSRALHAASGGGATAVLPGDAVREIAGRGLEWRRPDGLYRLGRPAFARNGGMAGADGDATAARSDAAAPGAATAEESATLFTRDGRPLAAFRFAEELKGDAAAEIARLGADGFAVYLLSGDRSGRVRRVADDLGVAPGRVRAETTPEEKAAWLRALDRHDTLMVGDGINDGPGFEAAWCAATPAVDHPSIPARADFYFLGEGIAAVRRALVAARRLRAVTRDNLAFAVAYNLITLALCYLGRVSPVTAAILMPLSSAFLVTVTARRLGGREIRWMS